MGGADADGQTEEEEVMNGGVRRSGRQLPRPKKKKTAPLFGFSPHIRSEGFFFKKKEK